MAAMTSIVLKEVKDITECPICTEMFSNPKMLPCFHTFCLKCIEQYCKDKKEGDTMPCPMCRKEFSVPTGGLSMLSGNFFMERLIAVQSASPASRTNEVANCDVCLIRQQCKVEASSFCEECQENMCDACSTMHKSMKMSMNHHLSAIGDPSTMEANKNKIRQGFCDKHSEEEVSFFCRDCKIPFCKKCFIAKHNKHEYCEIGEIVEEFKESLKQHTDDVRKLLTTNKKRSDRVDEQLAFFTLCIEAEEEVILQRSEEIKQQVERQTQAFLKQLDTHKTHFMKNLHTTKEELQRNMMMCENFLCYYQKAIEDAAAVKSIRICEELKTRAQELKEKPISKLDEVPQIFFPTSSLNVATHLHNIFGNLQVNYSFESELQGFAISKEELFCVYPGSPDIRVYNINSFALQQTITVEGMVYPWDIVATEDVQYISERDNKLIHRIQLLEDTVSNWFVDGTRLTLSISKNGNVIVSSWDPAKILEYTSVGTFIRKILVDRIDANLVGLAHAIQLEEDKFVVCHYGGTDHRVCIIDTTGIVIKCYGGNQGSGIGHLKEPAYLAIGRNGSILVADRKNNRLVQLDASLVYMNEFGLLTEPFRLRFNEVLGRLYVLESDTSPNITIYDI